MLKSLKSVFAGLITSLALAGAAEAGSTQSETAKFSKSLIHKFSAEIERTLAERGAHVAIVARVGRDPRTLPKGVAYTHTAFWVYSNINLPDGSVARGYAVHNLYQDNQDLSKSSLVQDYPADFVAGAHVLKAGVIIPDIRLQKKLSAVLQSSRFNAVHNPNYSVISNPNDPRFQNCTEHVLNVLVASLYDTDNITRIKTNIRHYFKPAVIQLNPIKRALGPIFVAGVETRDHTAEIRTATFKSIGDFMVKYDLADDIYEVSKGGRVKRLNSEYMESRTARQLRP